MLCREALQIGLVGDTCIELLRLYRNSYGLHRLTGAVLGRLGASFLTSGDDLFPQRAGLMKRLNTPSVDPVETASYAIAAIDAGLVELDAIAPHIETGPNGAGLTMAELQRSLIRRVKLPADAEGAFDFGIKDGHFILE